ncbi:MAG: PcfJ domain-containing protein [Treponema sp.]|nr:PcfJ domain-containing protein [Treponema sp.]
MINFCSYKYNPIKQSLEKATSSMVPQVFIPFNNTSKRGWCDFHKKWEIITIAPDNSMYFSCGLPVPGLIGLHKQWNKNQYELFVDTDNFIIRVNERWSWIDVYENQIYSTQKVYAKIIDFRRGIISHPKNFDMTVISPDINNKIMNLSIRLCKIKYGVEFHVENVPFTDFVKYPSCPEFNGLTKKIDNIKDLNFRADLNLFTDFCQLVQVKITKMLRKDFHKDPLLILLHAMAQHIGFINSDAIRTFVSDPTIYDIFITNDKLRFSIKRRTIYYVSENDQTLLNGLRLWVQNARTDKSDNIIVKRMIKFFKDTPIEIISDAIQVYYYNARDLPVAFHERILKEGFTHQMHDQLIQLFHNENERIGAGFSSSEPKVHNKKIEYNDDVLKFEDFIEDISESKIKIDYESIKENRLMMLKAEKAMANNLTNPDETIISDDGEENNETPQEIEDLFDYEKIKEDKDIMHLNYSIGKDIMKKGNPNSYYFALPKNTDELYEISVNMHNCVGYLYRNKCLENESIIVVLIKNGKMKACIEIKQNKKDFRYYIKQALGPANGPINRIYFSAIEEWKKRHSIRGEVQYSL